MHEELESDSNLDHANKVSAGWRWGFLAALAIVTLAILPQFLFLFERGSRWNGTNVSLHPDEVAYSAYVGSLIHKRSRRNDPFIGVSDNPQTRVPESLFSIQFVPAYLVAMPARWLGMSASTVFILGTVISAAASALVLFWLLNLFLGDARFAASAVCFVLCLGTLIARQGIVRYVPNLNFLIPLWLSDLVAPTSLYHLPFLRFYLPAVGFPFFFLLFALVWLALTNASSRRAVVLSVCAGITFVVLIFSYFYLWTAALAWLVCLGGLWILGRPNERSRVFRVFGILGVLATPGLLIYLRLLAQRSTTVDAAQGLVFTHRPDFFRLSEIVVLIVLACLIVGTIRKILSWRDPKVLFTASLAFAVIAVFNQQVITGRLLQATHYEWFIANYCALITIVLAVNLWRKRRGRIGFSSRRLLVIAMVALLWGGMEVWLAVSLGLDFNRAVDEFRLVAKRLDALAADDGTNEATRGGGPVPVVLVEDLKLADRLPTDAPQAVMWSPHLLVFPIVTEKENRERFLKQLYYLGYDKTRFNTQLDSGDWNFYSGLFPYYRLSPSVTGTSKRITSDEITSQLQNYLQFSRDFTRDQATSPVLSYLVVADDSKIDWTNLNLWYEHNGGERIGKFVLYQLRLKE